MGIGLTHAFHNHDNTVCLAVGEKHIHNDKVDCDQLHYFNQTLSHKIWTDFSIEELTFLKVKNSSYTAIFAYEIDGTDTDRGPPFFNVF